MNLGRIMGVILSLVFAASLINNNINDKGDSNPFELIGDNGIVTEESIQFDNYLNEDNNSNVEVIKYTNNQPYSISITSSDVDTNCKGSNENDVELVSKNMKVRALFSRLDSNIKFSDITIKPKESIYIYVTNEYNGEYPGSEVTCNYSIDIRDF